MTVKLQRITYGLSVVGTADNLIGCKFKEKLSPPVIEQHCLNTVAIKRSQ